MSSPNTSENRQDYCAAQVRTYDYHRYFAATLAPAPVRRGLIALYAFNLEIAATRERVSEALLGQMRLQWWRDTIEQIYAGTTRNHAVVEELADTVAAYDLPRAGLDKMIDGRLFDLEDEPPEDIGALKNYTSATSAALMTLSAQVCGQRDMAEEAESLGQYWGMAGLLRALPYQANQRRIYLPKDLLRAANITAEQVIERTPGTDLRSVIRKLADTADTLKPARRSIPKSARPAMSYVAVAWPYLRRLAKADYDLYAPGLEPSRFAAQLAILKSSVTGKV